MERFFMRRASAVMFLLDCRRVWLARIAGTPSGDVEPEVREIESVDRLLLDVRAGRIRAFELAHPTAIAVFVTD